MHFIKAGISRLGFLNLPIILPAIYSASSSSSLKSKTSRPVFIAERLASRQTPMENKGEEKLTELTYTCFIFFLMIEEGILRFNGNTTEEQAKKIKRAIGLVWRLLVLRARFESMHHDIIGEKSECVLMEWMGTMLSRHLGARVS